MLSINKAIYIEDNFCYSDCKPSVKTTTYVCNRFTYLFLCQKPQNKPGYIKFKSKVFKQINPTNQINDFFDRSLFLKSLYKSISKSIYVDSYYVLFVIIANECDVLSNEIFFLTSQKGGGIASVNYLKVKIDSTY